MNTNRRTFSSSQYLVNKLNLKWCRKIHVITFQWIQRYSNCDIDWAWKALTVSPEEWKKKQAKTVVLDMTLNWIWWRRSSSGEYHCYYSQVHSFIDIKSGYLALYNCKLFLSRRVTRSCNCLLRINISYFKAFNCVQTNKWLLLDRNQYK